jgi:hypothetical protein
MSTFTEGESSSRSPHARSTLSYKYIGMFVKFATRSIPTINDRAALVSAAGFFSTGAA